MSLRVPFETYTGTAGVIDCALDWPDRALYTEPRGWALVLHPHPLYGGTRENKVVTTLARVCTAQGLVALRPDFRGVGKSAGTFDAARGETDDMQALVAQFGERYPSLAAGRWVLAGFSFGTAVAAQLYAALAEANKGHPAKPSRQACAVDREGMQGANRRNSRSYSEDLQRSRPPESADARGATGFAGCPKRLPDHLILAGSAVGRFQHRAVRLPSDALLVHGGRDEVVPLQETLDWAVDQPVTVTVMPGASHFFHGDLIRLRELVAARVFGSVLGT